MTDVLRRLFTVGRGDVTLHVPAHGVQSEHADNSGMANNRALTADPVLSGGGSDNQNPPPFFTNSARNPPEFVKKSYI